MINRVREIRTLELKTIIANLKRYAVYYCLAVVCSTAFFAHLFVPKDSAEVLEARNWHKREKSYRTEYLNALKKVNIEHSKKEITDINFIKARDSILERYLETKIKTDNAFAYLNKVKEKERFFHFPNLRFFLGEFWAIGLLIYLFFRINRTLSIKHSAWKAILILEATILYCALFYASYLFINVQDYEPMVYLVSLLIVTIGMIYGIHRYVLFKIRFNNLKSNKVIRSLLDYILLKIPKRYVNKSDIKEYENESYKTIKDLN